MISQYRGRIIAMTGNTTFCVIPYVVWNTSSHSYNTSELRVLVTMMQDGYWQVNDSSVIWPTYRYVDDALFPHHRSEELATPSHTLQALRYI